MPSGGASRPPVAIDDPGDARLAPYRQLNDPARRRRIEQEQGIFVAEGHLAVEQLAASPYPIESVLVAPGKVDAVAPLVAARSVPVYVAPLPVLSATVGFDLHRGVVAAGRRLEPLAPAALAAASDVLLVLEGVNDHENLGALFRNARALGADGVLLDPTCADPLYRRSIRVSLGHVLRLPFARFTDWPGGLGDLAAAGFAVVALSPGAGPGSLTDVAMALAAQRVEKVAVLAGAEGPGLTPPALAAAGHRARIPMRHGVDSLNVATAAAIALDHLVPAGRA